MDKSTISRAFNKMMLEFLDDIILIVPENGDIKKTRLYFEALKSMNPSLLIKQWHIHVYDTYGEKIEAGDISFFLDKDYVADISVMQNATEVLEAINKLREPIRGMSETNKAVSMKYLQKMSQLSLLYKKTA